MFKKFFLVPLLVFLYVFPYSIKIEKVYKSGSLIKIPIEFSNKESLSDIKKITFNGFKEEITSYQGKDYIFHAEDVQYFPHVLKLVITTKKEKKTYNLHLIDGAPKEVGHVKLDKKRVKLKSNRDKMEAENKFFHPYFSAKREALVVDEKWSIPVKGKYYLTSLFGKKRVYTGNMVSYHRGTDLVPAKDKTIYATQDGVVVYSGLKDIRGNFVIIYHGYGFYTSYWHMSKYLVKKGEKVKKGQAVGILGGTGIASGPHLHWEARYKGVIFNAMDLLKL